MYVLLLTISPLLVRRLFSRRDPCDADDLFWKDVKGHMLPGISSFPEARPG